MSESTHVGTMDILAAAFFVIAGAWLLVALLYSTLVLVFLRLRARGELGSIYEDDFGRMYLCGTRYYIPLGCIFRRYIAHLQYEAGGSSSSPSGDQLRNVRFMTRVERRAAMETLLLGDMNKNNKSRKQKCPPLKNDPKQTACAQETSNNDNDEVSSSQEPLCSICLGEFDDASDPTFISKTCSHHFHTCCILDWLQRQANTECPCCRVAMVTEDIVWETVKKARKTKKREMRKRRKQQQGQSDVELGATENSEDTDAEDAVIEELPPLSTSDAPAPTGHTTERLDV